MQDDWWMRLVVVVVYVYEIHFLEVGNVDDGALYGVTAGRTGTG